MTRTEHVYRIALCAGLVMAASVLASADITDKSLGDLTITARIETMFLMNGDLNPFKIHTSTTDSAVTLTGIVHDQMDKDLAGRLAKTAKGVKSVDNQLTVKRDAETVKENIEWRQQVDDATLNTRVRRQLAYNSELKGAILDIDVNGSKVTVAGEVDSAAKKANIERIIDNTVGVSAVDSKLVVVAKAKPTEAKPPEATSDGAIETLNDEWVEKMVESSIMWSDNLSLKYIDVEVESGVCTLTGTVLSDAQKNLAGSIAKTTDGVKSVKNNITVSALAQN